MGIFGWSVVVLLIIMAVVLIIVMSAKGTAQIQPARRFSKQELLNANQHLMHEVKLPHVPKLPDVQKLICPHCQKIGFVTTSRQKLRMGISGGKAVGAILTSGISILATGISRKEKVTIATCKNCQSIWKF